MNIRLDIEYIGSNFFGWQKQKKLRTVQDEIEKTLKKTLSKKVVLYGSGRTDSGVHAINQVANFHINNQSTINMIGLIDSKKGRLSMSPTVPPTSTMHTSALPSRAKILLIISSVICGIT